MEDWIFAKSMQQAINDIDAACAADEDKNLAEVFQEALREVASQFHIVKIVSQVEIPANRFTPQGVNGGLILYSLEGADAGEEIVHKYVTGENGNIMIKSVLAQGVTLDEAKRADLLCLLKILVTYLAKSRLIKQMKMNGYLDMMTGLPNADGFIMHGNKLGAQGRLSDYAAFYFNLKNIKVYNQQYGAKAGDRVLMEVARQIREVLQEDEIAGRLGGDNFVALVHKENIHILIQLLENMQVYIKTEGLTSQQVMAMAVGEPSENDSADVRQMMMLERIDSKRRGTQPLCLDVRAACGVYAIEPQVNNMSVVMQRVSIAFRFAKDVVRKSTVIYTEEMARKQMEGKQIVVKFLPAMQNGELLVYYQPKVDIQTRCMIGAEALVRWKQGDRLLLPGEFVSVLEQDDNVCKLDFYVLEQTCRDLRRWIDAGITPVRISVNFSRRHLSDRYLVEEILAIMGKYRIPRRYIEVEITETTTLDEESRLETVFQRLHEEQIHVSIDDFGSGYSSLNMLRRLPVDMLKIDRSFIDEATNNHKDQIVLNHIIQLAAELGIAVITEGVETQEQLDLLKELRCNLVQGFYFDRPLAVECFDQRIKRKAY